MEKERSVDKKKYLMDSKHCVAYGKKDKETYSKDEFVKLAFDFINLGIYKKIIILPFLFALPTSMGGRGLHLSVLINFHLAK